MTVLTLTVGCAALAHERAPHATQEAAQTARASSPEGTPVDRAYRDVGIAQAGNLGSQGQFGWPGVASTWFAADPKEELVMLLFTQYTPRDVRFDAGESVMARERRRRPSCGDARDKWVATVA